MYKIVLFSFDSDGAYKIHRSLCSADTLSDANFLFRFYEKEYSGDENLKVFCFVDF